MACWRRPSPPPLSLAWSQEPTPASVLVVGHAQTSSTVRVLYSCSLSAYAPLPIADKVCDVGCNGFSHHLPLLLHPTSCATCLGLADKLTDIAHNLFSLRGCPLLPCTHLALACLTSLHGEHHLEPHTSPPCAPRVAPSPLPFMHAQFRRCHGWLSSKLAISLHFRVPQSSSSPSTSTSTSSRTLEDNDDRNTLVTCRLTSLTRGSSILDSTFSTSFTASSIASRQLLYSSIPRISWEINSRSSPRSARTPSVPGRTPGSEVAP
jgi:hypothetical protein